MSFKKRQTNEHRHASNNDVDTHDLARADTLIRRLRAAVKGRVIGPNDHDYDEARTVFYGGIDRHPAAIVRVENATDVSRVVSFARETGTALAIRSGGHSAAGHSVSEGGIVLDLSAMKALDINVEERTAWAETGLTAGEYTTAAAEYGLATGFGDSGMVGIGGITLGGGIGYLVRKHGLTIDHLLAAEIVTADGRCLYVDAESHPDLFWAIRGGGGNFGVVTRFKYQLHEVDQIVGGLLVLPASPENLLSFIAQAESAPEELSTIVNVMHALPLPFIPEDYHGQIVMMASMVYAGDVKAGEQAVEPFRELATPIADMIRPMTYPEVFPPESADSHPLLVDRTMFVDAIDQRAADVIFGYLQSSPAQTAAAHIRVLGGAMARVPNDATAFAHRSRRILVNTAAFYEDPVEKEMHKEWVNDFTADLRQDATGAYVNFLSDVGPAANHEAYPRPTWDRLAAVKARYDPTNLFRLNHNILPADA